MAAGADRLLEESAFIPRKSLTSPGTLRGRWLSKGNRVSLVVSQTDTNRAEAQNQQSAFFTVDEYTLQIRSKTDTLARRFTAAYGAFRIYGVDVDGDGVDEIVLERGEGRGTFVYVQKFEVLSVSESGFETVFQADLNGYIWNPDGDDPVSWERVYLWKNGKQGRELEFRLIPPPEVPRYCGMEEALFVLQHPRLRFRFNRQRDRFEIVEEEFRPLGSR